MQFHFDYEEFQLYACLDNGIKMRLEAETQNQAAIMSFGETDEHLLHTFNLGALKLGERHNPRANKGAICEGSVWFGLRADGISEFCTLLTERWPAAPNLTELIDIDLFNYLTRAPADEIVKMVNTKNLTRGVPSEVLGSTVTELLIYDIPLGFEKRTLGGRLLDTWVTIDAMRHIYFNGSVEECSAPGTLELTDLSMHPNGIVHLVIMLGKVRMYLKSRRDGISDLGAWVRDGETPIESLRRNAALELVDFNVPDVTFTKQGSGSSTTYMATISVEKLPDTRPGWVWVSERDGDSDGELYEPGWD